MMYAVFGVIMGSSFVMMDQPLTSLESCEVQRVQFEQSSPLELTEFVCLELVEVDQ